MHLQLYRYKYMFIFFSLSKTIKNNSIVLEKALIQNLREVLMNVILITIDSMDSCKFINLDTIMICIVTLHERHIFFPSQICFTTTPLPHQ